MTRIIPFLADPEKIRVIAEFLFTKGFEINDLKLIEGAGRNE